LPKLRGGMTWHRSKRLAAAAAALTCYMAAIPTLDREDAKRPNRKRPGVSGNEANSDEFLEPSAELLLRVE
jgi:hypothetical protein